MSRILSLLLVAMVVFMSFNIILPHNFSAGSSGGNVDKLRGYDYALIEKAVREYLKDYDGKSLRGWISGMDPLNDKYNDVTVNPQDFIDGNITQRSGLEVLVGGKNAQGTWINGTVWKGTYRITEEYGEIMITAYGAKDIAGNTMESVSTSLIVDTRGPTIGDVIYSTQVDEGKGIRVEAQISDDYSEVRGVNLYYRAGDSSYYVVVSMKQKSGRWVATIPGDDVKPSEVEFYIEDTDSFGNEGTSDHYYVVVIPWYIANWWIWLLLAILILFIILMLIRRRRLKEKAKVIPLRNVKASKVENGAPEDLSEYVDEDLPESPDELFDMDVEEGDFDEDFYE